MTRPRFANDNMTAKSRAELELGREELRLAIERDRLRREGFTVLPRPRRPRLRRLLRQQREAVGTDACPSGPCP